MTDVNKLVTARPPGWQYRLAAVFMREGLTRPANSWQIGSGADAGEF